MPRLRACFLDLDDTLVAFDAVSADSWRRVCADYARQRLELDPERLAARILEHSEWYWSDPARHRRGRLAIAEARREIVRQVFAALRLPAAEADALADTYSRVRLEAMYLLPGARDALEQLRQCGLHLGLITNGDAPGQRSKIERFGLAGLLDTVLIEGELGFGKPDPRIYERALFLAGCSAAEAAMVGDNWEWDVRGARRAGMHAVWVDRKGVGLPQGAGSRAAGGTEAPCSEEAPEAVIASVAQLGGVMRRMGWIAGGLPIGEAAS